MVTGFSITTIMRLGVHAARGGSRDVRDMEVRDLPKMPANRENPSDGGYANPSPERQRAGLRHRRLLPGYGNPSLTLGARIGARTDPLLYRTLW